MNKHIIKLIEEKKPRYGPIYYLNSVEPETLKIHIQIQLKTRLIQLSQSSTNAPIFFDKRFEQSL